MGSVAVSQSQWRLETDKTTPSIHIFTFHATLGTKNEYAQVWLTGAQSDVRFLAEKKKKEFAWIRTYGVEFRLQHVEGLLWTCYSIYSLTLVEKRICKEIHTYNLCATILLNIFCYF